jgi:hypothetical protein
MAPGIWIRLFVVSAFAAAFPLETLRGQAPAERSHATRVELAAARDSFDAFANSPAYSVRTREAARATATRIRSRLERGDFKVGDRFAVIVTGSVALNDTVTVLNGPSARIGTFGVLPLAGLLHAELEDAVRQRVVASVLDAVVTVRVLVRVAVFGAVLSPGFQAVPLETRLDELLMNAGGPSSDADPSQLKVMRGDAVILSGSRILDAIAAGETVGSLGLLEGDYLSVEPRRPPWDRATTLQLVTVFATPLVTFLLLR